MRLIFFTALILAMGPRPTVAQELPWERLSTGLMERMNLQPGERVLLMAVPGRFNDLIDHTRAKIGASGATDLGVIAVDGEAPDRWRTPFTIGAAGLSRDELAAYFRDVDIALMMPGATATHIPYAAMQDVLHDDRGRTIHYHWAGAYNMAGALLPNDQTIDRLYAHALLATDYSALAATQARFENAMRQQTVRVTTPEGTDLTFRIGDRPVTKQDGDASAARATLARNLIDREIELPAGAVRVAPIEESVNGTIVFPDATWNGVSVRGLVMRFERGRLVDFQAERGRDAVDAELTGAGAAGRAFREFALGFNPVIAIREDGGRTWIPYYGYGAGVVRLSLGDNTELGGAVSGGYVRWNFFPNATVQVGDRTWVRDGRIQ